MNNFKITHVKHGIQKRSQILKRSDAQRLLSALNGMIARNGGRGLINWLLKVSFVILGGNTSALARSAVVCIRLFRRLYLSKGRKGLVLYTKACYVLTMQAVGGHKIKNSWLLGVGVKRDRSGLPSVIPREHRIRIKNGNTYLIRIWLSWFSIYRILEFKSKVKLSTITEPGKEISRPMLNEITDGLEKFGKYVLKMKSGSGRLESPRFQPLNKTTPSIERGKAKVSWSPIGIWNATAALMNSEVLSSFEHLIQFLPKGNQSLIFGPTEKFTLDGKFESMWKTAKSLVSFHDPDSPLRQHVQVGKLGLKLEPAGKIRVFAMVECWTQWLLSPLHDFLFEVLDNFVSDGTHDQFAPVQRLIDRGHTRFWCYDLSAATDRLPATIQAQILDWIFGNSFGQEWRKLLVGRKYYLPLKDPYGYSREIYYPSSEYVMYAVGQPMGALSSWAMLALTHHFIVHLAARRAGYQWGKFWEYAVLGDDIVIAEGEVAGAYLQIMEALGVNIGLAKSLVSRRGVLEFAKRFIVRGKDCSPVPFKEMVAALIDFESNTEFVSKYKLGAKSIAGFLGLGYRARGALNRKFKNINKKLSTLGIWRVSPWGTFPQNCSSWLRIESWVIRPEWLVAAEPYLPLKASSIFTDWVSPELNRVYRLFHVDVPKKGAGKCLKELKNHGLDYMKRPNVGDSVGYGFQTVLRAIQLIEWNREIGRFNNDARAYMSSLKDWLFERDKVAEWKFLKWVDTRINSMSLRGPAEIGVSTSVKRKASPLLISRLYRRLR